VQFFLNKFLYIYIFFWEVKNTCSGNTLSWVGVTIFFLLGRWKVIDSLSRGTRESAHWRRNSFVSDPTSGWKAPLHLFAFDLNLIVWRVTKIFFEKKNLRSKSVQEHKPINKQKSCYSQTCVQLSLLLWTRAIGLTLGMTFTRAASVMRQLLLQYCQARNLIVILQAFRAPTAVT